jgi:BASS family bile acid:Na+ symporter
MEFVMKKYHHVVAHASRFVREWLLWLLLGAYVLAAVLPGGGLWVREVGFGELHLLGEASQITLSMALLALLLFNAGLDISLGQLGKLVRAPGILAAGLLANLAVPVLYIFGVAWVLKGWPDPEAVQHVVLGLALIAAMPIAASSAAWAQNANGNLALSLGLILGSIVLSPLTTPVVLHSVGFLTDGSYAEDLQALAGSGMSVFLLVFVLLPAVLGVGALRLVGEGRIHRAKPTLKLLNSVILLVLNYTNASASLPGVAARPDWGFLAVALVVAVGMCVLAFAAGWALARLLRAEEGQRTALMFGLGLNNNGTGLVLASVALSRLPGVILPVILYTLVQHVVAAVVSFLNTRRPAVETPGADQGAEPQVLAATTLPGRDAVASVATRVGAALRVRSPCGNYQSATGSTREAASRGP